MTLIRTQPKHERFRTIPSQSFVSFPSDVKPELLKVVGYCQGDKINRKQPLTIAHFDRIKFKRYSCNEKNKNKFIHATGYRKNEEETFLVLEV